MEIQLVSLAYQPSNSWSAKGADGRSSYKLHFFEKGIELPPLEHLQTVLNQLWLRTPSAFGYLAVKEMAGKEVTITLPPSTGTELRERFVRELEEYLRNKK